MFNDQAVKAIGGAVPLRFVQIAVGTTGSAEGVVPVSDDKPKSPQDEMFSGDDDVVDAEFSPDEQPDANAPPADLEADDPTYLEAVQLVRATKGPRADNIRRKLKITSSLAEEYLDRMEQEGIVTKADHSGQRNVIEDVETA